MNMEKTEYQGYRKKNTGQKIARIREFLGVKQEVLALTLGITQQAVSKMEKEEDISDDKLQEIAKALGVPVESIKDFEEGKVIYNINHIQTVTGAALNGSEFSGTINQNPLEKVVEMYERLLESEREKIELLKKLKED